MKKNSNDLDCLLILFYINVKYMLKTRKLAEKAFLELMVKHCNENSLHNYTAKEVKHAWRKLISKYIDLKIKGTPEDREKWKYFEILDSCFEQSDFHKEEHSKFSEEAVSLLIDFFTKQKISCIIHGYDSEEVLNEIKSKCRDAGIEDLTSEDIKRQWTSLTNIYKFLVDKGKRCKWVHFEAMKNHYQDDFWNESNNVRQIDKPRSRKRSKSMNAEQVKHNWEEQEQECYVNTFDHRNHRELRNRTVDIEPAREPRREPEKIIPYKKLKCKEIKEDCVKHEDACATQKVDTDKCETIELGNIVPPTSKISVKNISHSDIYQTNGNVTIGHPSVKKQFCDNEFLPLKKRLRIEDDNTDKQTNVEDMRKTTLIKEGANGGEPTKNSSPYPEIPMENYHEKSPVTLVVKDDPGKSVQYCESTESSLNTNSNQSEINSCEIRNKPLDTVNMNIPANVTSVDSIKCKAQTGCVITHSIPLPETNVVNIDTNKNGNLLNQEEYELLNNHNVEVHFENGKNNNIFPTIGNVEREQATYLQNGTNAAEKREFIFQMPRPIDKKIDEVSLASTNSEKEKLQIGKCRLPVKVGGKLKEIFISISDLSKINKLSPKKNCSILDNRSTVNTNPSTNSAASKIKFTSQIIKPAINESSAEATNCSIENGNTPNKDDCADVLQSSETFPDSLGNDNLSCNGSQKIEEFENESVISEAVGDSDGLRDNLLTTVIDFQEQNNQEFIEIKNLMKQNNLLQRETNRLLRLILEKS